LRKEGLVPCNLYGEKTGKDGKPEAMAFAIKATDLRKAVYTPHIYVIKLDIDGEQHTAIMK
jgi:large subunit ribosomal protein L25